MAATQPLYTLMQSDRDERARMSKGVLEGDGSPASNPI